MVIRQMNNVPTRVEYRLARRGVDYLTLLGLGEETPSRRFYLSRESREKLLSEADEIGRKLDDFGVTNSEKSQARAYIAAMKVLAEAPQPDDDLIWEIVSRANQLAGVASLFVSLVALFVSVKH